MEVEMGKGYGQHRKLSEENKKRKRWEETNAYQSIGPKESWNIAWMKEQICHNQWLWGRLYGRNG